MNETQAQKAGHTPLPWAVMRQNLRQSACDPRLPRQWEVPVTAGNVVAVVYSSWRAGEEGRAECLANAEFLCRAANAYYDLVAALEELTAGVGSVPAKEVPTHYAVKWDKLIRAKWLLAALRKAEAE